METLAVGIYHTQYLLDILLEERGDWVRVDPY